MLGPLLADDEILLEIELDVDELLEELEDEKMLEDDDTIDEELGDNEEDVDACAVTVTVENTTAEQVDTDAVVFVNVSSHEVIITAHTNKRRSG